MRSQNVGVFIDDDEKKENHLRDMIIRAYETLPMFHGPKLEINGSIICQDAWRDALEMTLDDVDKTSFSLENWLKIRVEVDGSKEQKIAFKNLLDTLDSFESNQISEHPSAMLEVCAQPLIEVDTYRSLDHLEDLFDDFGFSEEADSSQDEEETIEDENN